MRVARAAKIWPCCSISPTHDKSLPPNLTVNYLLKLVGGIHESS